MTGDVKPFSSVTVMSWPRSRVRTPVSTIASGSMAEAWTAPHSIVKSAQQSNACEDIKLCKVGVIVHKLDRVRRTMVHKSSHEHASVLSPQWLSHVARSESSSRGAHWEGRAHAEGGQHDMAYQEARRAYSQQSPTQAEQPEFRNTDSRSQRS
eukprot:scaffold4037_cov400-Prasinococcus_capsulatus_cf.AAC.5